MKFTLPKPRVRKAASTHPATRRGGPHRVASRAIPRATERATVRRLTLTARYFD